MQQKEKFSYAMLFCGLILVRNSKATMEQLLEALPLFGNAEFLVREIAHGKSFLNTSR
ncbi:MAG: hypothetical protein HY647_05475 [Acidobacteria bacterium]|nr:hypothetical protein [Acidobacteriota bacterium]